ncbi:MAG: DEAD/DEAH box helicase, partial [Promethearchaeota archaeon]
VILHHGPNRVKNVSGIKKYLKPHQIILTSFGTLRNDIDFLQIIPFNGIIVDESQNIKNYSSQQTQAILNLQSNFRICLSGTPLENRLIELWTLFEFLNPGLLGTRTEFLKKFVIPIERFQDQEAINKLKLVISPFILRRVKTDKSIINDLPEKNEIKIYVELTDQQEKLYKEVVDKTLKEIETTSSDKRKKRGIILKLLTHLKQLCNHPNQYLKIKEIGSDIGAFLSESQKMERLLEMTDEIISNTGKILIFTQFKQMGDLIKKTLELKYPFEILYFHGSVPENKRREIVDEFQSADVDSSPILILSLKAGGTGLNLTQGTTVIHFDSPWNPAIQDQATDRAYRIGQKFQVNVYKFITVGTIEEKIDKLLEEKRDLADKIIISSGESWISNLNDEKLRDLFTLNI